MNPNASSRSCPLLLALQSLDLPLLWNQLSSGRNSLLMFVLPTFKFPLAAPYLHLEESPS